MVRKITKITKILNAKMKNIILMNLFNLIQKEKNKVKITSAQLPSDIVHFK